MTNASKVISKELDHTTASVLLDTAERLFASKGIENVSTRQIVIASGHGNLSGAHYHFGTRDALINRLLERRMVVVDKLRNQTLDKLSTESKMDDLAAIVGGSLGVLADVVENYPWGRNYVLITAQAFFDTRLQLEATLNKKFLSGHDRFTEAMARLMPPMSPDILRERLQILRYESVYAVTRWLQKNGEVTPQNRASFLMLRDTLATFMTAGLSCPVPKTFEANLTP